MLLLRTVKRQNDLPAVESRIVLRRLPVMRFKQAGLHGEDLEIGDVAVVSERNAAHYSTTGARLGHRS